MNNIEQAKELIKQEMIDREQKVVESINNILKEYNAELQVQLSLDGNIINSGIAVKIKAPY